MFYSEANNILDAHTLRPVSRFEAEKGYPVKANRKNGYDILVYRDWKDMAKNFH